MAFSSVLQMYLGWANSILYEDEDLIDGFHQLRDGQVFCQLIDLLTGSSLRHKIQENLDQSPEETVQDVLDFLQEKGVQIKTTTKAIVSGELKGILDVMWALILHFTIHSQDRAAYQRTVWVGKKQLLQWCMDELPDAKLHTNKTLALNFYNNNYLASLIGKYCEFEEASENSQDFLVVNLTNALLAAEDKLAVKKTFLNPSDIINGSADDHALLLYLALIKRKVANVMPEMNRTFSTLPFTSEDEGGSLVDGTANDLPEVHESSEIADSTSNSFHGSTALKLVLEQQASSEAAIKSLQGYLKSLEELKNEASGAEPDLNDDKLDTSVTSLTSVSESALQPSQTGAVSPPGRGPLRHSTPGIPENSTSGIQENSTPGISEIGTSGISEIGTSGISETEDNSSRDQDTSIPNRDPTDGASAVARQLLVETLLAVELSENTEDEQTGPGNQESETPEGPRSTERSSPSLFLRKTPPGTGDELLDVLEAIGQECNDLRKELSESKNREISLEKELLNYSITTRSSTEDDKVISKLVQELEMLRGENRRLYREAANAKNSNSHDRKSVEALQRTVERLQNQVDQLNSENFAFKFKQRLKEVHTEKLQSATRDQIQDDLSSSKEGSPQSEDLDGSRHIEGLPDTTNIRELKQHLASAKYETEMLRNKLDSTNSDMTSKLNQTFEDLKTTKHESQRLEQENKLLKMASETNKSEIVSLSVKCEHLQNALIEAEQRNNRVSAQLSELQTEFGCDPDSTPRRIKRENAILKEKLQIAEEDREILKQELKNYRLTQSILGMSNSYQQRYMGSTGLVPMETTNREKESFHNARNETDIDYMSVGKDVHRRSHTIGGSVTADTRKWAEPHTRQSASESRQKIRSRSLSPANTQSTSHDRRGHRSLPRQQMNPASSYGELPSFQKTEQQRSAPPGAEKPPLGRDIKMMSKQDVSPSPKNRRMTQDRSPARLEQGRHERSPSRQELGRQDRSPARQEHGRHVEDNSARQEKGRERSPARKDQSRERSPARKDQSREKSPARKDQSRERSPGRKDQSRSRERSREREKTPQRDRSPTRDDIHGQEIYNIPLLAVNANENDDSDSDGLSERSFRAEDFINEFDNETKDTARKREIEQWLREEAQKELDLTSRTEKETSFSSEKKIHYGKLPTPEASRTKSKFDDLSFLSQSDLEVIYGKLPNTNISLPSSTTTTVLFPVTTATYTSTRQHASKDYRTYSSSQSKPQTSTIPASSNTTNTKQVSTAPPKKPIFDWKFERNPFSATATSKPHYDTELLTSSYSGKHDSHSVSGPKAVTKTTISEKTSSQLWYEKEPFLLPMVTTEVQDEVHERKYELFPKEVPSPDDDDSLKGSYEELPNPRLTSLVTKPNYDRYTQGKHFQTSSTAPIKTAAGYQQLPTRTKHTLSGAQYDGKHLHSTAVSMTTTMPAPRMSFSNRYLANGHLPSEQRPEKSADKVTFGKLPENTGMPITPGYADYSTKFDLFPKKESASALERKNDSNSIYLKKYSRPASRESHKTLSSENIHDSSTRPTVTKATSSNRPAVAGSDVSTNGPLTLSELEESPKKSNSSNAAKNQYTYGESVQMSNQKFNSSEPAADRYTTDKPGHTSNQKTIKAETGTNFVGYKYGSSNLLDTPSVPLPTVTGLGIETGDSGSLLLDKFRDISLTSEQQEYANSLISKYVGMVH